VLEHQQKDVAIPAVPRRILVAEDSPVAQDLLKLILTQRGHTVDIADDGEQALSALGRYPYDVALIDFRLPKLDGLQVAQKYRSERDGDERARLIAITADVEGLLSHNGNCESFDRIIAKPLDLYEVCNVIERASLTGAANQDGAEGDEAASADARPAGAAIATLRQPKPNWALGLELLQWPDDFNTSRFPHAAISAFKDLDSIDAILVRGEPRAADLGAIWENKPLHLFPIIDLGGHLGPHADFDASRDGRADGDAARRLIQGFHQRRSQLHGDLLASADLGEKLLARLFVQDAPLTASYDPSERSLIRYNLSLAGGEAMREAEKQYTNGFLAREFFERFHVCYRCSSSRLHIREECPACRFSQLREESYIHHFKCGHQSISADFQHGERLICPKCRQELSHFSVDYDKPGSALVCERCGHAGSEPAVGFVCMDCAAHFDSDTASARDIYSYALTPAGIAFLQMGQALRGPGQRILRFSDLPLELVVALNNAAKRFNDETIPFAVVNLSYEHEREIVREAGLRQFAQTRDLFLENLKNELGDRGLIVKGHSCDFCLLHKMALAEAESTMAKATASAAASLRFDLGAIVQIFGPEDFV
jgi:CheY-like chemotaxis protein